MHAKFKMSHRAASAALNDKHRAFQDELSALCAKYGVPRLPWDVYTLPGAGGEAERVLRETPAAHVEHSYRVVEGRLTHIMKIMEVEK